MSAADNVVIDHILQDKLVGPIGIKRVVFFEIYWKFSLDLIQLHLSPSLTQNTLQHFILIMNIRIHKPILGDPEMLIKLNLLGEMLQ